MELDFLTAVLPSRGSYCAFTLRDGKPFKTIFVDTIENLYETVINFSNQGLNAFHGLATFDKSGSREAPHALLMRSLFIDLDCGKEWKGDEIGWKEKSFTSKKAAVEQLEVFLNKTGLAALGSPWLVDSGGGVHVYWPLDADATIDEWKPVATALKVLAQKSGFPIDYKVTSDASRVLRTPGTSNFKYGEPKPVVLRERNGVFNLEALRGIIGTQTPIVVPRPVGTALMLPGTRPKGLMTTVAKALAGNSITLFKNIMVRTLAGTGCNQIKHYIDHASDDGVEPLWRSILSIAKYCDDGEKAALKLSAMHPYDVDRMHTKLAAIKGPYSCAAIESENPGGCKGCPHQGKITNPLILGREAVTTTEPVELIFEPEDEAPVVKIQRPTPPPGYSYGRTGGVYFRKKGETPDDAPVDIMLTNYDLFMTRMFRDEVTYMAEFVVVKGAETTIFSIPTSVMGSPKDITKALATCNVFAVQGAGCDGYLANYARACMTEASSEGKYAAVPPRFGWQEDGSFAVGDTVYSARGREFDYTFKSSRLNNIMEATRPKGTLEEWQKLINMLYAKAIDDKVLWGHCAVSLTGFASTLMRFAPNAARASTIHACGKESGAGKTLASHIANSTWGEPTGLMVSNKTSETTMMQRAGMLGSLHMHVDEVTDRNRKSGGEWLPNYLYDFSNAAHKVKGSATGNAEIQQNLIWNSLSLISSNDPALEGLMGARAHSSFGEVRRFLEWRLPADWTLSWTPEERAILKLMEDNHGVVGRRWIEWLLPNIEVAEAMYKKVEAQWREVSGATDTERFWTGAVVASLTAVVLLGPNYSNLMPLPYSKIEEFWLRVVNMMRKVINANKTSAIDILNSYTREYIGNFVKIDGTMQNMMSHLITPNNSSKNAVRGRIEYDVVPGYVDYYIELKMMQVHCASVGRSYIDFAKEITKVPGILVTEARKDLLKGTKGPTMRVKCLKISRLIADVDAENL